MGTSTLFFVLGAADPEMSAIEGLLRDHRIPVSFAAVEEGGELRRVRPAEAYRATAILPLPGLDLGPSTQIVRVECEFAGESQWNASKLIDHHRPGDPGFGKAPSEYWAASSLGQVFALLYPGFKEAHGDLRLTAAADHCLGAAYRGECPGVDPDTLMRWRVSTRARFQGRPEDEILRDVEAAREALRNAPRVTIRYFNPDAREDFDGTSLTYADLRDRHTPELPEAAAREGICFIASLKDGRTVCQAGSPDHIRAFLDGYVVGPLHESYGDPARGFAGGKACGHYHKGGSCSFPIGGAFCQEVVAEGECPHEAA